MDANGNQRKRTVRLAKPDNNEGMGPPPQIGENKELLEVSALATFPTPNAKESVNNAPAAECRRSSRKKIIKFDVRDLLNKNRKPHKIQIEARIDSNAPTTSKTSVTISGELTSAKPSSMSGDLLSKQKTFLEKSAIFRRYSISQEPKPPPPPLPLPPSLLGKAGDSKDATVLGNTTTRRLSRTQEFFSNVMIKPKQTTSLIVAQMESSAPSGKRKILNRYVETETSNSESVDSTTVQKRRGRPSKTKIKSSEDIPLPTSKEDIKTKKLTPEKARNWKEYKACLAQQTGTNEDMNTQGKIEVSSQNTLKSLTTGILLEISSSSSHNTNIEDFTKEHSDNKSLTDEQHRIRLKDDAPIELDLLSEICIDDTNSKHSIINPTPKQEDLNETAKKIVIDNENQINEPEITAPQPYPEKLVPGKPRDSKDTSANEHKEEDINAIDDQDLPYNDKQYQKEKYYENEKETNSSQSTIKVTTRNRRQINQNESLQKTTEEYKQNTTSANLDDSSQDIKFPKAPQSPKEKATGKIGQTKYSEVIQIEGTCQTGTEETIDNKRVSKIETESEGQIITNISDDSLYTESNIKSDQISLENKSNNSSRKEKDEQNTGNTNEANQNDYLQTEIDTTDLKSSQEVTNTRESRSKYKNTLQEKDLKLSQSREKQKTSNRSPNNLEDLLQKEKNSKNPRSNRRSRSKHNNSPKEKTLSQSVSLTKEVEAKYSKSTAIEINNIKSQPEIDSSLQSNKATISDQSCTESMELCNILVAKSLQIDSKSEAGQLTKEAMTNRLSKNTVSLSEKTTSIILQSIKEPETAKSSNGKNESPTQKKEEFTEVSAYQEAKDIAVPSQTSELIKTNKTSFAFEEVKDNTVPPQTPEQTKTQESSIKIQTKTIPSKESELSKKVIIEQKEDVNEVANEYKKLSETLDREKNFEEVRVKKDTTRIKKSPRNKRNLNKNDSSTSKQSNEDKTKLTNTTEQSPIEEDKNYVTNVILASEERKLKTPDASSNTTQVEQEKPTNGDQETLLSQPSTPLERKLLTLSRTSSSSESENQSERSSFSSATTSSTSTSTRSYKSGDKLKIAIKRISLPESPSSSSQISTSEEQSSSSLSLSEDIKKKPKTKRSKRLQKKFLEMLGNQDPSENIDDCFKKITDIKDETELQSKNDVEKKQENVGKESPIIENKSVEESVVVTSAIRNILEVPNENYSNQDDNPSSIELGKEQTKCVLIEETDITSTERLTTKEPIDTINPTTSKEKNIKDNSTVVKRKSLRNRKENDKAEKGQETKESDEVADATVKGILLQENKSLRILNENDSAENDKETVSEAAETAKERNIQQQQEQQIECQILQESNKSEYSEQQEKLTESKQKQRKKRKEKRLFLINPKQQQKRNPKDDMEKGELEKQAEVQIDEKLQEKIQLKEQEVLLTEPSSLIERNANNPPVEEIEGIGLKAETVHIDEKQLLVSTDPFEDETIKQVEENIKTKEIKAKESVTEKTKQNDDDICEFKKVSSMTTTEINVNENTPTRSKSIKDKRSIANDSDKIVSGKLDTSCTDSKETETSKITSRRSKTVKDKTISLAEPPKTLTKSSKEFPKADTPNLGKEFSKEEIHLVKAEETFINVTEKQTTEKDSTQNIEDSGSNKDKETNFLPPEETSENANNVIDKESCNSISKISLLRSNTAVDTYKYVPDVTELQSPTLLLTTKAKSDIERPTSAKRKSLRNQKDKNSVDTTTVSSSEINEQDENCFVKQSEDLKEQSNSNEENKDIIEVPVNTQDIKEIKLDILTNVDIEEPIKIPKRRARKSRFKNLHSPEIESETESSTGKQTPIEETVLVEKKDEQALNAIENVAVVVTIDNTDAEKDAELIKTNEKEMTVISKEHPANIEPLMNIAFKEIEDIEVKYSIKSDVIKESTLDLENSMKTLISQTTPPESYLMQNVSIETNTLLDILRTVQSNTAAALEANNKKTENLTQEISDKDEDNIRKNIQISLTDLPSTSQDRNSMGLESLRKLDTDSNTNSPTRCEISSPLTLKKVAISPTRSDSNSPLTLKKVGLSPTRSDTSSPLTLKKVTRRYERRSRRGEDSAHKTLEETFAEIAAQSSKAVLAAKSFDCNEEFAFGEMKEKDDEIPALHEVETAVVGPAKSSTENQEKVEDINKSVTENFEKNANDSAKIEDKVIDIQKVSEVPENSKNTLKTDKSDDNENSSFVMSIEISETNILEKDLETPVSGKVTPINTPARRGRKPKNRSMEAVLPTSKDNEIQTSPKSKKDVEKSKVTLLKDKDSAKELEEVTSEKVSTIENPLKSIEDFLQKSDLETVSKIDDIIKFSKDTIKEINELSETPETTLKSLDSSKISKKSNKKRDSSKELPVTPSENDNVSKEDDVRTPKQAMKKRDSPLTKSETKSLSKKSYKKNKNNEEELIVTQKEDNLPKTTTPPPKRGRKPKNQQELLQTTNSSKKKNKKESSTENDDNDVLEEKRKDLESESESVNSSFDKSLDEKMAKKKRQKKLKEAFEAALTEDLNKNADITSINSSCPSSISSTTSFGFTLLNKSPPPESTDSVVSQAIRDACMTPVEEDPDPLKDIEKFIADGVNLLKKDYKLDEDSVGDVITTTIKTNENEDVTIKSTIEEDKPIYNTFETPADTPVTTPSVTPPPKSPTSVESTTPDENSGVRRSHRIKLITQTPKALVGRGLVRDKERFSIKDDVETKSHYTLDDHLLDLAEVEAKNAKFLKEMEERLSNFQVIKENEYLCERVISREARKMICDCFLTQEEEERGELGCGEDCLNRLLMIECGPECNVKERCTNKRFQKFLCSPCRVFRTEKKGFGIMADIEILPGEFIMEYVGEVIDTDIFEQRRIMYSQDKNRHYYFMALRSDAIIDATIQGNISRFINHSCDPNAETQKWTVNGELRIGFFSRKSIMPGEEITFNYQYQRYGREAQRCYCESSNCRGWIGQEPTSDEGEQIDDDDDYEESEDEEEEEEQVTSNLLVHDDDEDSDASVTDPEEVQKKLEMAAAQAEAEFSPINICEDKETIKDALQTVNKESDSVKPEAEEEDSKSKFKKLLSKMAEKVAAKQKQNKRQQKLERKKKSKESSADLTNKLRFSEDPDIEDEVAFLRECGLKNQSDTLRLSRLMVRAKLVQTRLNLLDILRKGDLPCRRLFLDYHGLRLVHGWMSEDAGNMQIRLSLLQTLETLPIANKTVLTDSKVMQMVRNWCGSHTSLSPNDDSSSSNSNSQDNSLQTAINIEEASDLQELHKLALKLITAWEGLPEIFRIPKKERIEQMKEHEREADRQYAANAETEENKTSADRYRRNRFGTTYTTAAPSSRFTKPNNGNPLRALNTRPESFTNLSKAQRREMFAAKVARDEAEKRMAEERREFETKCRFFGLDPKKTRPQDVPFCVNPVTGQWYSVERKPIITPPSYTHVQVPVKPQSTDPNDYQLPAVCSSLNSQWKFAITPQGKIYYYHIKYRIPQWEPPTPAQLQQSEMEVEDDDSESELTATAGEDSSEDDDEILIGMDAVQLRAYIDRKVESRRQKRYQRLVDQRAISPRREEDRVYNQIEIRKYKENKEKIRKRKEEIRRKRAEALRQSSLNMCTLGSVMDTSGLKLQTESDEELGVLPIQDYLLSSDEDGDLKADVNTALIDKIVEGDKIVDELDALTSKRLLKRPLPPHRDLSEPSTSSLAVLSAIEKQEYKKRKLEKKEKKKPKDLDAKYRKNKEKFRCEIAGIIVHYLKPYRRESCPKGHIQSDDDFNHLARKLTHFVMIKELKYCESVGQTLVVTESVKNKSREFIKKYMAKYGNGYVKPTNDPEFKDIPFTL